jgi:hypothetical protein
MTLRDARDTKDSLAHNRLRNGAPTIRSKGTMTITGLTGIPLSRGSSLDKDAEWFEQLLRQHHVTVANPSALRADLDIMKQLGRAYRGEETLPDNADVPHLFRRALGLDFIIKAIYRASKTPAVNQILGKLSLFCGPDVLLTEASPQSQERDLVWEVIVACLSACFTTDLTFAEPDVRCDYEGTKWGSACKILYTTNRDKQIGRIVGGAKQLGLSTAELGCVVVNVSNSINHQRYFGRMPGNPTEFGSFRSAEIPLELLKEDLAGIVENLDRRSLVTRLTEDLQTGEDRIKTRGVIFLAQTVCGVRAVPMLITRCDWYVFRRIAGVESSYFALLNHFVQTTLPEVIVGV